MKLNLSLLAGVAMLAAVSGASAQTAVTDPVGYITVNVAAGSAAEPKFSAIAPTLVNKVEFSGASTAVAGTAISFGAGSLTAAAFDGGGFYAEVTSGAGEGEWKTIASNTADSVTLSSAFSASVTTGATIKIRKHVTLGSFFGTANSAGLGAGGDAASADEVIILNSATQALTSYFYSNLDGFSGWFDVGFNPAENVVIAPNQGLLVARKSASAVPFVYVGHVKTGKTQLGFNNGFNVVPVPLATGTTLGASNLFTGSNATGMQGGGDAAAADEIIDINSSPSVNYFYSNLDGFSGWFDVGFTDASNVLFSEGEAFLINRKGGGAFAWTAPAQVIAN